MTIDIRITGYNRETAGPLRVYEFSIPGPVTVTGNEDQFEYGMLHARSIIRGLQALDPLTNFSIRAINTDGHGGSTVIDGVDIFEVGQKAKAALAAEREARKAASAKVRFAE